MHPVLVEFLGLKIGSFGVLVALGYLAGLFCTLRLAKGRGVDPGLVNDLLLWVVVGGVLGARLLYVLVHPSEFRASPLDVLAIWKGGLVFYGGFAGAFLLGALFLRRRKASFLDVADVCMPGAFLGLSIGRWGCFLVGDDHGRVTGVPWAVRFPDVPGSLLPRELIGQPLHPTQIYLSINALLIFLILLAVLRHRAFRGQVLWCALALYSAGRFFIEFYRGDDDARGIVGPLSTSQWIGIPLFILGVALLWRGWRLRRSGAERSPEST
jgi:phosphatidylglycerol:prolipoprotein diacylglycerol transferase